jgi:hypothetical protein
VSTTPSKEIKRIIHNIISMQAVVSSHKAETKGKENTVAFGKANEGDIKDE